MNKCNYLRFKLNISTIYVLQMFMQNFSDFIMKCAIFEEHSSSCAVYSRFSGTLFPVSMIDGGASQNYISVQYLLVRTVFSLHA